MVPLPVDMNEEVVMNMDTDNDEINSMQEQQPQQNPDESSSRIRLSASILKEDGAMDEGNDDEEKDTTQKKPLYPKLSAVESNARKKSEYRRVRCPPHRYTPLREHWEQILTPLVEYLKLQVRFNTKQRRVELKTSPHTVDHGSLQKGADFVSAFMMGFEVQDAVALLRLDDLYVESFQVTDVKMLRGDHLSRAIGRVAGQDGKTRFAIENATRTRIVIADQRIHLLGSYANLRLARNAICDLVLGAPPGKVYNSMRNVAKRMSERY